MSEEVVIKADPDETPVVESVDAELHDADKDSDEENEFGGETFFNCTWLLEESFASSDRSSITS